MRDLTDADWKRIDEHLEELGKEWKAEAERLQPYTDILKKHLKKKNFQKMLQMIIFLMQ